MRASEQLDRVRQGLGVRPLAWTAAAWLLASCALVGCRSTVGEEPAEFVVTESTDQSLASEQARPANSAESTTRSSSEAPPPPPAAGTALGRRIASGSDPLYPTMSRKLREEGSVDLAIDVANDGSLRGVRIVDGSGHARLDEAALAAVRGWTFKPRTGDEPNMVYRQRFVFRLKSAQR